MSDEEKCDDWHYVCRYANGEAYRCPHCQEESVQLEALDND